MRFGRRKGGLDERIAETSTSGSQIWRKEASVRNMSKFWTLSGINSPFDPSTGDHTDYVWESIKASVTKEPDRRYASRLGTQERYDNVHKVGGIGSKRKLDREASDFAEGILGHRAIAPGQLRGKEVRVVLVAPKTGSKPPISKGLQLEIFWSPNDQVPNQRLIGPDSLGYWRKIVRGTGQVWPIKNRTGTGIGRGHDFNGFLKYPPIVKRRRRRPKGSQPGRYEWKETGESAPSPIAMINEWIEDARVDYVIVAHSQGTNIAVHLLRRGFKKP